MLNKAIEVKKTMLNQIEQYLNGEITRRDLDDIAEEYYTENAHIIDGTEFYKVYSQIIIDACLVDVEEPGDEEKQENHFHGEMEKAHKLLKPLCDNS